MKPISLPALHKSHACCKTHTLAHTFLCTYPCSSKWTAHTHPHRDKHSHALHNSIGLHAPCFFIPLLQSVCSAAAALLEKQKINIRVLHVTTRARERISNTILPVVFLIDDSDSSPVCINSVLMEWVRIEMPVTVHLVYYCYLLYPRDSNGA